MSDFSKTVDSDRYFTEPYREMMENVLHEPILPPGGPAVTVPIHSSRPGGPAVTMPIHSSRSGLPPRY